MSCEGIAMNVEVVVPTIACVRVLPACGWCCQHADTTCYVGQRGFALFGVGALSGSCFRLVPVKCTLLAGLGVNSACTTIHISSTGCVGRRFVLCEVLHSTLHHNCQHVLTQAM